MRDQDVLYIALGLGAVAFFMTQRGTDKTPEIELYGRPPSPPPTRMDVDIAPFPIDRDDDGTPFIVKKPKHDYPQHRADEAIRIWMQTSYTEYRASVERQILLFFEYFQRNEWPVRQNIHDDLHRDQQTAVRLIGECKELLQWWSAAYQTDPRQNQFYWVLTTLETQVGQMEDLLHANWKQLGDRQYRQMLDALSDTIQELTAKHTPRRFDSVQFGGHRANVVEYPFVTDPPPEPTQNELARYTPVLGPREIPAEPTEKDMDIDGEPRNAGFVATETNLPKGGAKSQEKVNDDGKMAAAKASTDGRFDKPKLPGKDVHKEPTPPAAPKGEKDMTGAPAIPEPSEEPPLTTGGVKPEPSFDVIPSSISPAKPEVPKNPPEARARSRSTSSEVEVVSGKRRRSGRLAVKPKPKPSTEQDEARRAEGLERDLPVDVSPSQAPQSIPVPTEVRDLVVYEAGQDPVAKRIKVNFNSTPSGPSQSLQNMADAEYRERMSRDRQVGFPRPDFEKDGKHYKSLPEAAFSEVVENEPFRRKGEVVMRNFRNLMAELEETGDNWGTLVHAMKLYFSIQHVTLTEEASNGMYSNQTTNTYEFTPQRFAFAYLNLEVVNAKERLEKVGSLQLQSDMMGSPEFRRYRGWVTEMNNTLRPHLELIRRAQGKGAWPVRYHTGDREPTPYRLEGVGFNLPQVNEWLKEHKEMEKLRPKRLR